MGESSQIRRAGRKIDMSEACAKRDLVQNAQALFLLWGVPPVTMLLSVCCAGQRLDRHPHLDPVARRHGRRLPDQRPRLRTDAPLLYRSVLSSPGGGEFFFGLRLLPLGPHGWLHLGALLLVGGGLLSFAPEWLCGRYR